MAIAVQRREDIQFYQALSLGATGVYGVCVFSGANNDGVDNFFNYLMMYSVTALATKIFTAKVNDESVHDEVLVAVTGGAACIAGLRGIGLIEEGWTKAAFWISLCYFRAAQPEHTRHTATRELPFIGVYSRW